VGKSSLFNRLIKHSLALVDDFPGVTRDRQYADLIIGERSGILVDTGGFDFSQSDPLLSEVATQIKAALNECDLAVFVTDGISGIHPWDTTIRDLVLRSQKPAILAVNKIDSPEKEMGINEFYALGFETVVGVSAAHGFGIKNLEEHLASYLVEKPENEESSAPRIAVIGKPNAGKSSLINALVGQNRLVVDERPGTTRDSVDVGLTFNDQNYILVDTAGVRRRGKVTDRIEKFSVIRSLRAIDRADISLLLIDSEEGISDQDANIAGYAFEKGRPLVILFTKWDKVKNRNEMRAQFTKDLSLKMTFQEKAPWFTISSVTGIGLNKIFPLVDKIMVQYNYKVSTSLVNQTLEQALKKHSPPQVGNVRLKFYYSTQICSKPPTFVLFANRPGSVHFSYKRFLINRFKESFGLDLVPVRIFIRKRHEDRHGGKGKK
jgi:GTP-binding protein